MQQQLLIFGDICPDNDYRALFDAGKTGAFSEELSQIIAGAALVIGNLECPSTDNNIPITKCGPSLRAEPKDIQLLKNIGFDVLSLANNHILDFGMQGVYDTLASCKDADIQTVGAGKDEKTASEPIVCNVCGKKLGIISYAEAEFNLAGQTTPGANHFDPYESYDQVEQLKKQSDFVVVIYHGGIEHYKNPSPLLQKKCRKFVSAGADLVLCQHSHCIGTMEKIGDATIIYGQGNSVFGYREGNDAWNEGLLVGIDIDKEFEIQMQLIKATPHGIIIADKSESKKRIEQIIADSERLNEPDWIRNQWVHFCQKQEALNMPLLYGWSRVFIKLNMVLRNKLFLNRYSRKKIMTTMNLVRCEAHHEVIQTILEEKIF